MIYGTYVSELLSLHDFEVNSSLTDMLTQHFKDDVVYNKENYALINNKLNGYEHKSIFNECSDKPGKVNLIGVKVKLVDEDIDDFLDIITDIFLLDTPVVSSIDWLGETYNECMIRLM